MSHVAPWWPPYAADYYCTLHGALPCQVPPRSRSSSGERARRPHPALTTHLFPKAHSRLCFPPSIFTSPSQAAPKPCTSSTKLESSIRIPTMSLGRRPSRVMHHVLYSPFVFNIVNICFPRSLRFASTRWRSPPPFF